MICKYFLIFITCKGIFVLLFSNLWTYCYSCSLPCFSSFPFHSPHSLFLFLLLLYLTSWFRLTFNPWSSSISFWMLFHFKCLCIVSFFSLFILFYLETFEWLKKSIICVLSGPVSIKYSFITNIQNTKGGRNHWKDQQKWVRYPRARLCIYAHLFLTSLKPLFHIFLQWLYWSLPLYIY